MLTILLTLSIAQTQPELTITSTQTHVTALSLSPALREWVQTVSRAVIRHRPFHRRRLAESAACPMLHEGSCNIQSGAPHTAPTPQH